MIGGMWGPERSKTPRRGRWSQAEIGRLRELYGLRDNEAIAKEMCRPVESVQKMAEQIFATTRRTGPWTTGEVERLKRAGDDERFSSPESLWVRKLVYFRPVDLNPRKRCSH